ncbi:hypothetical protein JMJ55_17295 [Belnapia sp. T6]|uniref:Uncharacterized protein n=1 Tax=Belnapia mucosa TaxID=2804532 RepID=A0ABS1V5Y1_9PROT|nr:hypothetical protein [Belnapia mucosa]MBL6457095.1 hypothetical protein [Belnapia mucosa]
MGSERPNAASAAGLRTTIGRPPRDIAAEIERNAAEGSSRDRVFGFGGVFGMLGLALLVAAPLGWALNQAGLIPDPDAFELSETGRELAKLLGRDMVRPVYWLALGIGGYLAQICRPLVPLLLIGGMAWWSWLGLSLAHEAGLIAMPIHPPASADTYR